MMSIIHLSLLLLIFIPNNVAIDRCPKMYGTSQVKDGLSVKASEASVIEYISFVAANNFDTALFPNKAILSSLPYKELFDDLKGKIAAKPGRGGFPGHIVKLKGTKAEQLRWDSFIWLPISGISYEQAIKYCNWLENGYNASFNRHNAPCYAEVRLPTKDEYSFMIRNIDSISGTKYNYNTNDVSKITSFSVSKYGSYKYGLHDIQGNVAEMTSEKNIAAGGSYFHHAIESFSGHEIHYSGPERWLGFRYVGNIHSR